MQLLGGCLHGCYRSEQDVEGVIWEVDIMREHKGHPSAPALKGVYEDDQYLHLVRALIGRFDLNGTA